MKKILSFIVVMFFMALSTNFISAQSNNRSAVMVHQQVDEPVIIAYPNPARDVIMVKSKDLSLRIRSISFYSILGMKVAEFAVNKNSDELRLDRLRPGKYLMVYILSDNTQKVMQIVKQ